jgi:hypothetical protein
VIGADRESRYDFEADISVAERIEQLRRQLAEPQALPDMAFGNAEAGRDGIDRLTGRR